MSVDLFLQLVANGFAIGCQYAVFGLSFGLIYNTTRVFHFAHGATYAVAAYTIYVISGALKLSLLLGVLASTLTAGGFGVACEAVLYRRLRRRGSPPMLLLVASLGVFIVTSNVLLLAFGGDPRTLGPTFFPGVPIGTIVINPLDFARVCVGAASAAVVAVALYRTSFGRSIRAVVDSPFMATVVGLSTDRISMWTYAVGSALVVPVALLALLARGAAPDMGQPMLLSAAIAVFVGGIGVIPAAALAGVCLGLLQNIGVFVIGGEWQSLISFIVLIAFLVWRPAGLFGRRLRRAAV